MHSGLKKGWIGFLILIIGLGLFLTVKSSHLIVKNPDQDQDLKLSRKQRSANNEGEHVVNNFRKIRIPDYPDTSESGSVLIDDLKALLELKHQIQTIKEESVNQNMSDDIRQIRLQELEVALKDVSRLKISVEKRMKRNEENNMQNDDDGIQKCNLELIETVPDVLIEKDLQEQLTKKSIFEAWLSLLDTAIQEIDIMSQWAIDGVGKSGEIFKHMKKATERNVRMNVLFNSHADADMDTGYSPHDLLKNQKFDQQVHVGAPNISGLIHPDHTGNIVHSKLMIADNQNLYIGSGNLGSRCTTRTKEMGFLAFKCSALAMDAKKIWKLYNYISVERKIPEIFPQEMETSHNLENPLKIFNQLDGFTYKVVIGSSPVKFCPSGRADDLSLILNTIDEAKEFIHISVGEYVPMEIYANEEHHWNVIDDHLKNAVIKNGVEVKFLVNEHASHKYLMKKYLRKLSEKLRDKRRNANIQLKFFSSKIDKHRFHGSHGKFMVTEKAGYIGTSNWAEDYFTDTAGTSIIFSQDMSVKNPTNKNTEKNLVDKLEEIFRRDWYSDLSKHF